MNKEVMVQIDFVVKNLAIGFDGTIVLTFFDGQQITIEPRMMRSYEISAGVR